MLVEVARLVLNLWVQEVEIFVSLFQTFSYASADFFGRVRKIMPCSMHHQIGFGTSITRGSDRNSARYFLSAAGVGASGVPRFVISTPIQGGLSCL